MLARPAELIDAERISALMSELGYQASSQLIERKLLVLGKSANDLVLAVDDNETVIGVVSLHVQEMFHQEGRLGRITSLVIDEQYRGIGVGTLLVSEADRFFKRSVCVRAEVTSGDHRPQAHMFYQQQGYQQDERRFLKRF